MNTKNREKTHRRRSCRVAIRLPTDRFAPQLRILYAAPNRKPDDAHLKEYDEISLYVRHAYGGFFKPLNVHDACG